MKQQDSESHITKEKKINAFLRESSLPLLSAKIRRTKKRLDFFTQKSAPRKKKKKENARSLTARVGVSSKRRWRNSSPGDTTTRSLFFFFCINGFRARGELNSWNFRR